MTSNSRFLNFMVINLIYLDLLGLWPAPRKVKFFRLAGSSWGRLATGFRSRCLSLGV
jgi:hypothetical protein